MCSREADKVCLRRPGQERAGLDEELSANTAALKAINASSVHSIAVVLCFDHRVR